MHRVPLALLHSGGPEPSRVVVLQIGEVHASREPEVLCTLLGSCIAVCLYDIEARVGGMNHILMPGRADPRAQLGEMSRFAHDAVDLLARRLLHRGARRRRLRAKIFGGADVLHRESRQATPGERNARFVLGHLEQEGIAVAASDLGGVRARKVWFRTDTGEVVIRRLTMTLAGGLHREERNRRGGIPGSSAGRAAPCAADS